MNTFIPKNRQTQDFGSACFTDGVIVRSHCYSHAYYRNLLLPGHLELPVVIGAIPQIEVDQGLVWNAFFVSQGFEVVDGAAIDVDGDLLFQTVCIGIFSGVQLVDIVFVSHNITSNTVKINLLLSFCCTSCRDNSDSISVVAIAMAYNTDLFRFDRTDYKKAFFLNGMVRIVEQNGELVVKDLLCSLER